HLGVPLRPDARGSLELAALDLRIEVMDLDLLALVLLETVDADDDTLAALDLLGVAVGGFLDLALDESGLHGGNGAAELLDPVDQPQRARLERVGQLLEEERAPERVGGVRPAGLVLEDLLCPQRDPGGVRRRQRKRLVERVRVQRLRTATDGG